LASRPSKRKFVSLPFPPYILLRCSHCGELLYFRAFPRRSCLRDPRVVKQTVTSIQQIYPLLMAHGIDAEGVILWSVVVTKYPKPVSICAFRPVRRDSNEINVTCHAKRNRVPEGGPLSTERRSLEVRRFLCDIRCDVTFRSIPRYVNAFASPRVPREVSEAALYPNSAHTSMFPHASRYNPVLGNGMEEVVGSIPTRSTNSSTT
jgi:hypothetical protein